MNLKESLLKEMVRRGYHEHKNGRKTWEAANRSLLYITPSQAKAFLNLAAHPRYKKTVIDIETDLLKKHAKKFMENVREPFNLIDMGCTDGSKATAFIQGLENKGTLRYMPVSLNKQLLNLTLKNIRKEKFSNIKEYKTKKASLESLDEVASIAKNNKYRKNVILLLGSILASYDIHAYLFNLSQAMFRGDRLIIGNGIRTGERFQNIKNYTHPAFNNWLHHVVKEMGIKPDEADYNARFANGRVEMYYTVTKDKKVKGKKHTIDLKEGDEIIAGILYKYYQKELLKFCKMYFREVELVTDPDKEYALVMCKK